MINVVTWSVFFGLLLQIPLFPVYGVPVTTFDVASVIILLSIFRLGVIEKPKVAVISFWIVILGLFSIAMNFDRLESIPQGVLYSARIFEYSLWFYVGLRFRERLIKPFILLLLCKAFASFLVGTYVDPLNYLFFKYDHDVIGTLLLVSLFYLKDRQYIGMYTPLFSVMLMNVRSAYFGFFYIMFLYVKSNKRSVLNMVSMLLLVGLITVVAITNEKLMSRLTLIFDYSNIIAIKEAYHASLEAYSYHNFVHENRNLFTESGDLSFQLRLRKWMYYIGQFSHNPTHILYGFSPGSFGGAADSSVVRIFLEGGVLMFYFYLVMIRRLVDYSFHGKEYIYLLVAMSLMLDLSFSSAVAPLVFFLVGVSGQCRK